MSPRLSAITAWFRNRRPHRAHRDADPYLTAEWRLLREVLPEGKSLRRRRRKARMSLASRPWDDEC